LVESRYPPLVFFGAEVSQFEVVSYDTVEVPVVPLVPDVVSVDLVVSIKPVLDVVFGVGPVLVVVGPVLVVVGPVLVVVGPVLVVEPEVDTDTKGPVHDSPRVNPQ